MEQRLLTCLLEIDFHQFCERTTAKGSLQPTLTAAYLRGSKTPPRHQVVSNAKCPPVVGKQACVCMCVSACLRAC